MSGRQVSRYICIYINQTKFHKKTSYLGLSIEVAGPGQLAIIEGNMNSPLYQRILKENVRSPVCELRFKHNLVMQQDKDFD